MSIDHTDVLIAGAGLAGTRTAEGLRALGFDGRVVVAGTEPHPPYERPALSKQLLLGERQAHDLALRPSSFWEARAIELRTGATIESVDVRRRRAVVAGNQIRWRHLVLATGVRARRIRFLDGLANVHHLRTIDDAEGLRAALVPGSRLAIVGAGFVGLEAASAAVLLGVDVTVVEPELMPFARTLGAEVGARMGTLSSAAGVDLRLGQAVAGAVVREGVLTALELADGSRVPCDTALVGVGAVPNSELAVGQVALAPDHGVVTDACGRTSVPGVYACGDVASVHAERSPGRLEHWSAASAGGRAVAHAIVDAPPPPTAPAYFWTDQFGHRLQVVGRVDPNIVPDIDDGRLDGFVARYRDRSGRLLAAALLDRTELLAEIRSELATLAAPLLVAA